MSRRPFFAVGVKSTLALRRLDHFEALWSAKLPPVDEANIGRGGWSRVYLLELEDLTGRSQRFYLKRQQGYLIRSLRRPLGEPTVAREFQALQNFARKGIPAPEAVFYDEREVEGGTQAVLLTRGLDDYQPLHEWFNKWSDLTRQRRNDLLLAAASLVRCLHNARLVHNSLYPKHIFLKLSQDGARARLIDLEKARFGLGLRARSRDLETLYRRSRAPSRSELLRFLLAYLEKNQVDAETRRLIRLIVRRRRRKREAARTRR